MTDGIIQEVFKRLLQKYPYCGYDQDVKLYTFKDIQDSEKELIQKIKGEFQYCKPLLSLDKYTTLQKRLIGDNND